MDLRQLRYFIHVCDAASISEAALHAHVSQPAISRQLKLLEDELGVPLIERHSRGIVLTDAGMALRAKATRLIEEASSIRAEVISSSSIPHGTLSIGSVSSLRDYLIAPALAAFRTKYDRVSFRLLEGTSLAGRDAVASGGVDLAFVSTMEDLGTLGARRLLTEQLFLVGHSSHRLSIDKPVSISALAGSSLILTARPNSLRIIVDRALQRANRKATVAFEVGSLDMAIQLIQLGVGFSAFPFCAVDAFYRRGQVSIAPIKNLFISWALAFSLERRLSTAARLFMDFAAQQAKARVESGQWPTSYLSTDAEQH